MLLKATVLMLIMRRVFDKIVQLREDTSELMNSSMVVYTHAHTDTRVQQNTKPLNIME